MAECGQAGCVLGERIYAEIDNDIAEIARFTALLDSFGERHHLPEAIVFHIKFAFDELLTNIISYGFTDTRPHKIAAWIGIEGNTFEAEIVDDGIAFNPLDKPTPDLSQSVDERPIGGLGIHFIRTVMDHVDYHRAGGRNHLKMIKKLPFPSAEKG